MLVHTAPTAKAQQVVSSNVGGVSATLVANFQNPFHSVFTMEVPFNLINTGRATAQNVTITSAQMQVQANGGSLYSGTGPLPTSYQSLPFNLGSLAPNATQNRPLVLQFPSWINAGIYRMVVNGTFAGGAFSTTVKVFVQ
jgi:hypothetical protein